MKKNSPIFEGFLYFILAVKVAVFDKYIINYKRKD